MILLGNLLAATRLARRTAVRGRLGSACRQGDAAQSSLAQKSSRGIGVDQVDCRPPASTRLGAPSRSRAVSFRLAGLGNDDSTID